MCDAGLLLDKDSKELQELRVQIQDLIKRLISHHQKDLKKKCQTTHACDVDFRMVLDPHQPLPPCLSAYQLPMPPPRIVK